jgi:Helicase conserved C-terminal domain
VTFFAWLCGLNATELGQIIANRMEVALLAGPPRDRAELATRLQSEALVAVHYLTANQPVHDVAEMVAASAGQSTIEALAKAFDLATDDRDLSEAIDWLTARGLAWSDTQGLHLVPALVRFIPRPHGLGGPARAMLEAETVSSLRAISAQWGMRPEKTKARLVDAMVDWLAVPDNVRQLLGTAPAAVRAEIERLAWKGPVTTATQPQAVSWALEHGLVYSQYWNAAEMPGEVGRALRGPDWRPAFRPRPPEPTTVAVAPAIAVRESVAAAMTVLEQMTALTAECARKPVPALKTGGIGVRELRRLSKVVGCDERSVRLWLEVAFEASLLELEGEELDDGRLLATAEYDAWLAKEPAARLTELLIAWRQLNTEPYADANAEARVPALVEPEDPRPLLALARQQMLTAANRLPHDKGLVADDGLAPVIAWQVPGLQLEPASLASLWQEARAMGIVAHGILTQLGRALVTGDDDQLVAAARDLVGTPTTSAIFQADLTAVVPGIPDHALASLLDSAADRESRGGALIWRFSSASVRRAFDAGVTSDELTARLIAVSGGGVIPQPLAYLIGDIGRQYGRVRVREVGCVIHGVEEALLSEIIAAKALRGLGLTRLAPTVLAAASPQAETLAALRSAGYFPAAEQPDGSLRAPVTVQLRASTASLQTREDLPDLLGAPFDVSGDQIDPYALAEQLCSRPPGREPKYPTLLPGFPLDLADPSGRFFGFPGLDDNDGDEDDSYQQSPEHSLLHLAIEEYAEALDPDGVCALATAIEFAEPARVTYRPIGSRTKLRVVIEPESLTGEYVRGRELSSGKPIKLRLGDIERVHPM